MTNLPNTAIDPSPTNGRTAGRVRGMLFSLGIRFFVFAIAFPTPLGFPETLLAGLKSVDLEQPRPPGASASKLGWLRT